MLRPLHSLDPLTYDSTGSSDALKCGSGRECRNRRFKGQQGDIVVGGGGWTKRPKSRHTRPCGAQLPRPSVSRACPGPCCPSASLVKAHPSPGSLQFMKCMFTSFRA